MSNRRLQEQMFAELDNKELFKRATELAYDYMNNIDQRAVFPDQKALNDLQIFEESLPTSGCHAEEVIELLGRYGSPATNAQIGGRYFGFVNGGVLPVSLAGRWLADSWDQNSAMTVTSPVAARLESVCENWLKELLALPDGTVAGFVSGSSLAIFCGLAAARYRQLSKLGWDVNRQGMNAAPALRIIAGNQAHATVVKGLSLLGFGIDAIEWIPVDDQGRILASEIPELDETCIVILQAGNVSSGAFDPFEDICRSARDADAWVHIDGAFGLWAAASSQLNHLTRGIELAHSFSVDAHKTLNTPYDCGIVLCADEAALTSALHASASYITYGDSREGMLYTPEMSRRARAVDVWTALKYLGRQGVDELVTTLHCRAVQLAEEMVKAGFTVLNDVVFNQVLVSCDSEELTRQTLTNIQSSGECWCGGAQWNAQPVIRVSVCSWATTESHITRTVRAFVQARDQATLQR